MQLKSNELLKFVKEILKTIRLLIMKANSLSLEVGTE